MRGGRTEIELKGNNIHRQYHNKDITITYRLSSFDLWFKPLLLVFYIFCAFLFMLALFREKKVKTD